MEDIYVKIINTLMGLLLIAYGVIFKSLNNRITDNKFDIKRLDERADAIERVPAHTCLYPGIEGRVSRLETEAAETRPLLIDIRTRLMEVQTDLKWIKKKNHKD